MSRERPELAAIVSEPAAPAPPDEAPATRAGASSSAPNDDTQRLFERYARDRDQATRDTLIERFTPLARRLARRYGRGSADTYDDLVQVATIGLINAVDRYDSERGPAFTSFATPTILGELRRYFRDSSWAMHVPRGLKENILLVERTTQELLSSGGRSPSVLDITAASGLDEEAVLEALEAGRAVRTASLDAPAGDAEDPDTHSLGDTIGELDAHFELAEYGVAITSALKSFSRRERMILHLRFVEDRTQSEIAARVGVSQMQVSRLLSRMLADLRISSAIDDGAGT